MKPSLRTRRPRKSYVSVVVDRTFIDARFVTDNFYDLHGRLIRAVTTSGFDGNGATDQNQIVEHVYDASGNLVRTINEIDWDNDVLLI